MKSPLKKTGKDPLVKVQRKLRKTSVFVPIELGDKIVGYDVYRWLRGKKVFIKREYADEI